MTYHPNFKRWVDEKVTQNCMMLRSTRNFFWVKVLYFGMVNFIKQSVYKNDYDFPFIIDGMEGSGKSAFAVNLACDLDNDFLGQFAEKITWDAKCFKDMVYKHSPSALIHDEIGLDMFSRDSMKGDNKRLIKMFMVCRERNHIPLLVLPNKLWIDNYGGLHRAKLWVRCVSRPTSTGKLKRGFAEIHLPFQLKHKKTTYWNHAFTVRFPDFPVSIKQRYKMLKMQNSHSRMFSGEETADVVVTAMRKLSAAGMSQRKIADLFNCSPSTVSNRLRE